MFLIVKGNVQDSIEAVHAHDGEVVTHKYQPEHHATYIDADIQLDRCVVWFCEAKDGEYPPGTLMWYRD